MVLIEPLVQPKILQHFLVVSLGDVGLEDILTLLAEIIFVS